MESKNLCCSLYWALTLDPVPIIGDALYISGAEGLRVRELNERVVKPCHAHRFNFMHAVSTMLEKAAEVKPCSCETAAEASTGSSSVERSSKKARQRPRRGESPSARGVPRLLADEFDFVVAAYKWLQEHRSSNYSKCCEAVIVCQIRCSKNLPPGLYVYKNPPLHLGCTVERPLTVVDQFNFICPTAQSKPQGLPGMIVIEMFPGRDNFSAVYVIARKEALSVLEYSNRMFGEARASGILKPSFQEKAAPCHHYEVAMRTNDKCVIDLRWRGFDTKAECLRAVPRLRGLQALIWSNHAKDIQATENAVISWLFGLSNELPSGVHLVDHRQDTLEVRYILMDMETFPGALPNPPDSRASFFVHTYSSGDLTYATRSMGEVSEPRSRMGTPCLNQEAFCYWYSLPALGCSQPTPFSCGIRDHPVSDFTEDIKASLLEWTLKQDGTGCQGISVQHTLYYHAADRKYRTMLTHVMEKNGSLNIFRL